MRKTNKNLYAIRLWIYVASDIFAMLRNLHPIISKWFCCESLNIVFVYKNSSYPGCDSNHSNCIGRNQRSEWMNEQIWRTHSIFSVLPWARMCLIAHIRFVAWKYIAHWFRASKLKQTKHFSLINWSLKFLSGVSNKFCSHCLFILSLDYFFSGFWMDMYVWHIA